MKKQTLTLLRCVADQCVSSRDPDRTIPRLQAQATPQTFYTPGYNGPNGGQYPLFVICVWEVVSTGGFLIFNVTADIENPGQTAQGNVCYDYIIIGTTGEFSGLLESRVRGLETTSEQFLKFREVCLGRSTILISRQGRVWEGVQSAVVAK